ncbi:MAG: diacylglycerol kinase family lipid kinase [Clostridia bacterium]|nr:diacylglycerol kinase family lipid kinase [Clostridia bacterium]
MADKKKALLIVNPCSGKDKTRAEAMDIVDKFSHEDYEISVHPTKCQGDATNIVKEELADNELVICCGGDGTLNETINGVIGMPRRVPVGYLPSGTTNDLAASLNLPVKLHDAAEIIKDGHTNDYDIGLFNNRCFCYVASFGAFARSSYSTPQKLKNTFGYAAYLAAAVPQVFEIHATRMRIEYDGGVIEDDFMFGAVSNSLSVGGFFKLPKDKVKFNDGLFEVLLVKKMPMTSLFSVLSKVRKQKYDGKQIILLQTRKLKIHAPDEEVAWTLDGEYGGKHHDVMVNILEKAVEIYSPENDQFLPRPQPETAKAED